ncbi:MAG: FAD binding domain-containing protein [Pseudomonadota bacterium]
MVDPAFHTPRTLEDATFLLADLKNVRLVSGGQWLVPRLRSQDIAPDHIVTTQYLEDLTGIRQEGDCLIIGAAETHDSISLSQTTCETIPELASLAARIGDQQVRNRGTIGGALASDPAHTDYSFALVGLDGSLITNKREIPAAAFLGTKSTAQLADDEILISIRFRIPASANYQKLAHPAANYAEAGLFISRFENGETKLIIAGKDQWPIRLIEVEELLTAGDTEAVTEFFNSRFSADPFFASRLVALLNRYQH